MTRGGITDPALIIEAIRSESLSRSYEITLTGNAGATTFILDKDVQDILTGMGYPLMTCPP